MNDDEMAEFLIKFKDTLNSELANLKRSLTAVNKDKVTLETKITELEAKLAGGNEIVTKLNLNEKISELESNQEQK